MILIDTSVWIGHFRAADSHLTDLLMNNGVLVHPAVIGEVALGSVAKRAEVLRLLRNLPAAVVATHDEILAFIERRTLANTGLGYVDAGLLASAALTPGATLWSRDKHLHAAAARFGLAPALS